MARPQPGGLAGLRRLASGALPVLLVAALLLALWGLVRAVLRPPDYMLPSPVGIGLEFFRATPNGDLKLVVLANDAAVTWLEALVGFTGGAAAGFLLAVLFTHLRIMERGLLPYVVASQTVPIIAIAPMVVVWLGTTWVSKSVIAAYLTFFPVTINALRGFKSVDTDALDLMRSYGSSGWDTFFKLRLPNSLPYVFTALKISATASVVGAIIGELPVGSTRGIGVAIINGAQYNTFQPEFLWAAMITASLVGIGFYLVVVAAERATVAWRVSEE